MAICATRPSAKMTPPARLRSLISRVNQLLQLASSPPAGLFSGGRHLSALVILTSRSRNPTAHSAVRNVSPELSPKNGTPVRLAPWAPGASPTISRRASTGPTAGTGLFQWSGFSRRRDLRSSTIRGQRAHLGPGPAFAVKGLGAAATRTGSLDRTTLLFYLFRNGIPSCLAGGGNIAGHTCCTTRSLRRSTRQRPLTPALTDSLDDASYLLTWPTTK